MFPKESYIPFIILIGFTSLVIVLQLFNAFFIIVWIVWAVAFAFLYKIINKSLVYTIFGFGLGFFLYVQVHNFQALNILIDRLLLLVIILPLLLVSKWTKSPFNIYWQKPNWEKYIFFPFIWSGFHAVKIKYFLAIAIVIGYISMIPFIHSEITSVFLLTMILFSVINACLEEVIWRGALLSRFAECLGEKWAVVITSIGFGLQHYSLGFSWVVCVGFIIGGLFYGGITVRSDSIIPAIIWHFLLNIGMCLCGVIPL